MKKSEKRYILLFFPAEFLLYESVAVAVPIYIAVAAEEKSRLRVTLGIKAHHIHSVRADIGDERDIMQLGHFMGHGDEYLVLDVLDVNGVSCVGLFGIKAGQGYAAAAYKRLAHRMYHVAADGADIKARPLHIARHVPVGHAVTRHKLYDRYAEGGGQRLDK